jgi:hypothetical protein
MKPLLPDIQRLEELRSRGMNYQEIADWIEKHEGVRVSRMSIASAFSRAGRATPRPRYEKHLPWKVKAEHGQHYAAKMLRLMGRRDSGMTLSPEHEKRLDSWLDQLRETHSVVVYAPETDEGFHYVDGDFNADGIPLYSPRPILPKQKRASSPA